MDIDQTRVCKNCGEEKELSDFYFFKRVNGNVPYDLCKTCYKLYTKKNLQKNPESKKTYNQDEQQAIDVLRQNGIYATSGKASEFKWVDIAAWGCVRVEVKTSRLHTSGTYRFTFSAIQRMNRLLADVILLVFISDNEERDYYVFRADDPVFFSDGQLRQVMTYRPDNQRTQVLSSELLEAHKDKWSFIEDVRLEIIQDMLNG